MKENEQLHALALTRISGLGLMGAHQLVKVLGSAVEVFRNREQLPQLIPGAAKRLVELLDCPDAFERAEKELLFAEKKEMGWVTLNDEDCPSRHRECEDAPLALFYRGNADLNALRVINIVGTRNSTPYGHDLCKTLLEDLSKLCPDILIVSGLAYGIDIHAHRAALQNGFNTVGVLAHGLDRIYPSAHRNTAIEMMQHGGLLTEFMSGTNPDRQNFVKRNRIVAESYHRDCFAFPGRINDEFSSGCNELIRNNRATLITSAEDVVNAMNWTSMESMKQKGIQRQLFPDLSEEEQCIVGLLQRNPDGIQINTLVVEADIPINRMSALLFELEMKGVVRAMAGGVYRII